MPQLNGAYVQSNTLEGKLAHALENSRISLMLFDNGMEPVSLERLDRIASDIADAREALVKIEKRDAAKDRKRALAAAQGFLANATVVWPS